MEVEAQHGHNIGTTWAQHGHNMGTTCSGVFCSGLALVRGSRHPAPSRASARCSCAMPKQATKAISAINSRISRARGRGEEGRESFIALLQERDATKEDN